MKRKTLLGLSGVLGIWITAGLSLPLVNILNMFTPTQLMTFRGFITALIAYIGLKGVIKGADKYTYLIALVLPLATLGLYQGIRHWGAGPTIIIITATPIVNVIIGRFIGRKVSSAAITGLILLLTGIIMTQWGGDFQWIGLFWSLFGAIMNGILYELFSRTNKNPLQKCFYACLGMGILGLISSSGTSWGAIQDPKILLSILGFSFVGGFLYWIANLMAFENLPTTEASVLAQGETPAVIIGASFLLNEQLGIIQCLGVGIALIGACYLSYQLAKNSDAKTLNT